MEKASRWIVAAHGILYLMVMAVAAILLPASDTSDPVVGFIASSAFLRGGICLVVAAVCLHVVSAGLASLIIDYPRASQTTARPAEASVIAALGTGLASIHAVAGVFYGMRAHDAARLAFSFGSIVAAFFAFFVAFAFLRAERALVIGYVAIGVGLAQTAVSISLFLATSGQLAGQVGLLGSLATAAFAILVVMLGFVVAAGAD